MSKPRDIAELLQDFDHYGNTATERYTMRIDAYFEIMDLRKQRAWLSRALWEIANDQTGNAEYLAKQAALAMAGLSIPTGAGHRPKLPSHIPAPAGTGKET